MQYLLFWTNGSYTRDTEQAEPCTLKEHLADLRRWCGTPDFFNSFDDLIEAANAAQLEHQSLTIVDENDDYKVLDVTKEGV